MYERPISLYFPYILLSEYPDFAFIYHYLIDKGINMNYIDESQRNALFYAINRDTPEILQHMIQHNISVNQIDICDDTPLSWAIFNNKPISVIKLLINTDINYDISHKSYYTMMDIKIYETDETYVRAILKYDISILQHMISQRAPFINYDDDDNNLINRIVRVHYGRNNLYNKIKILIDYYRETKCQSLDPFYKNKHDVSAYDIVTRQNNTQLTELFNSLT